METNYTADQLRLKAAFAAADKAAADRKAAYEAKKASTTAVAFRSPGLDLGEVKFLA